MVRRHAPHSKIIAVLKANAYGHGLLPVAHALAQADAYAVARVEEALVLRANAITKPILVLGASSVPRRCRCWRNTNCKPPCIPGAAGAARTGPLPAPSRCGSSSIPGMNRLGLRALELPAFIERLSHCRNVVQPFHLMTHFSQSDEQDTQATRLQIEEFNRLSAICRASGP